MGGVEVTDAAGRRWRIRRRWLDRPLPDLRERFREYREQSANTDAGSALWAVDFSDSLTVAISLAVLTLVVVVVLLPLLGLALELIVLAAVFGAGLVGRVVLRRPWTVEAVDLDDGERSASYAVKGWQRSGRAVTEIASTISASGPPERIAEGIKL